MYRERGAPDFAGRECSLIASLNRADLQRVRLRQDLESDVGDGDPGLLLLDDHDGVEMANPAAAAWLDELRLAGGGFRWSCRRSPSALGRSRPETAASRRRRAPGRRPGNGSPCADGCCRTAARPVPRSRSSRRGVPSSPSSCEAYGLTARERRVSKLVAQGLPNAAIAARLYLSTYTVQDHLKAIFEKLDVSNRGQLVARLFLDPYQRSAGV